MGNHIHLPHTPPHMKDIQNNMFRAWCRDIKYDSNGPATLVVFYTADRNCALQLVNKWNNKSQHFKYTLCD